MLLHHADDVGEFFGRNLHYRGPAGFNPVQESQCDLRNEEAADLGQDGPGCEEPAAKPAQPCGNARGDSPSCNTATLHERLRGLKSADKVIE